MPQYTKLIKAVSTNISLLNKFLAVKTAWAHQLYCEWWDSLPKIWQEELSEYLDNKHP